MRFLDRSGRIFVYGRPVDMRKGFTGLQGLVLQHLRENPLSGDVFVFINRRRSHLKCLMWDRAGPGLWRLVKFISNPYSPVPLTVIEYIEVRDWWGLDTSIRKE